MRLNYQMYSVLVSLISCVIAQDYYDYNSFNERHTTTNFICTKEGYHEDPNDCKVFYRCVDWGDGRPMTPFRQECSEGTVFSKIKGNICTYPWDSKRPECNGSDNNIDSNLNKNPDINSQMPECIQEGWMEDPDDCMRFYRCTDEGYGNYKRHPFTCGAGTVWDIDKQLCNHPSAVNRPQCRQNIGSAQSHIPDSNINGYPSSPGENSPDSNINVYPSNSGEIPPNAGINLPYPDNSNEVEPPKEQNLIPEISNEVNIPKPSDTYLPPVSSVQPGSQEQSSPIKPPNKTKLPSTSTSPIISSTHPSEVSSSTFMELTSPSNLVNEQNPSVESISKAPVNDISKASDNDISDVSPTGIQAPSGTGTSCTKEGFFPNPDNCHKFIRCVGDTNIGYRRYDFDCGPGTAWDQLLQTCNHAHLVDSCKSQSMQKPIEHDQSSTKNPFTSSDVVTSSKPITEPSLSSTKPQITTSSKPEFESTPETNFPSMSMDESKPDCEPQKPINYTVDCKEEGFKAVPENCKKFYRCVYNGNGFNVYHFECSDNTIFDPSINVCNYPESVYPTRNCAQSASTSQTSSATPSSATSSQVTDMPITTDKSQETTTSLMESDKTTIIDDIITTESISTMIPSSTPEDALTTIISTTMDKEITTDINNTTEEMTTMDIESTTAGDDSKDTESTVESEITTSASSTTEGSSTESETSTEPEKTTENTETESTVGITTESVTDSSSTTTEVVTTNSDTTIKQETTTGVEATSEESTTESKDTTEEMSTPETTPSGDTTTLKQETSSPLIPPGAFPCPIPNLSGDQFVLACPSGFRRYPKYCNLFYQCTTSDAMEVKILVFSCPKDTIFDEKKIQCITEEDSDQPCEDFQSKPSRVYRAAPNLPTSSIVVSNQPLCPSEGHFPYKVGCSNTFYKCTKGSNNLLQGYLYKCPEDFVYWSVSRRCERINRLPMCNYIGTKNVTSIYKHKVLSNLPTEFFNISAKKNRRI